VSETPKYKRVLLKLSGEAFKGSQEFGVDHGVVNTLAVQIREVHQRGVQTAIVVGGGNIFRGSIAAERGMDRATADYMGMLATTINAIALQDELERIGVITRVQTAIEMREIAEPFIRRRAIRHLEKGRVVIFAAGSGNPFFTTDTASVLRAAEINAEVILKATNVDGVYDRDPKKDKNAVAISRISYIEVLNRQLKVMDSTAISLSMDNNIPIIVFNIATPGNILRAVMGEEIGTLVQ